MKQSALIIDDCKITSTMIRRVVGELGVETYTAYSGEAGIAMAVSLLPDVILLDVQMPGIDGFEVCRRLKADPSTATIPVIFLTGETTLEEKVHGLNLGGSDYICKPFDTAELQARIMVGLRTKYLLDILAQKGMIDGVTSLWNRTFFDKRLPNELIAVSQHDQNLASIMIDLDHFKRINDRYGHASGDHVLRQFSQLLLDTCRSEDLVCRYGGEEFSILLPGLDIDKAVVTAEQIRQATEKLNAEYRGQQIPITCSLGVSDYQFSAGDLVRHADDALYYAKLTGRNRVERADNQSTTISEQRVA